MTTTVFFVFFERWSLCKPLASTAGNSERYLCLFGKLNFPIEFSHEKFKQYWSLSESRIIESSNWAIVEAKDAIVVDDPMLTLRVGGDPMPGLKRIMRVIGIDKQLAANFPPIVHPEPARVHLELFPTSFVKGATSLSKRFTVHRATVTWPCGTSNIIGAPTTWKHVIFAFIGRDEFINLYLSWLTTCPNTENHKGFVMYAFKAKNQPCRLKASFISHGPPQAPDFKCILDWSEKSIKHSSRIVSLSVGTHHGASSRTKKAAEQSAYLVVLKELTGISQFIDPVTPASTRFEVD